MLIPVNAVPWLLVSISPLTLPAIPHIPYVEAQSWETHNLTYTIYHPLLERDGSAPLCLWKEGRQD